MSIPPLFEQQLARQAEAIPAEKRGQLTAAITTAGAELGLGARGKWKGLDVTGTGWAGRAWGGGGWAAGARATFVF